MVTERIDFKNSGGLDLVGEFLPAEGGVIVVMVHGLTGDRHEGGRFDKAAQVLNSSGFNVFRFDFSGCGESDDDNLTIEKQVDDLKCVLAYVKSRGLVDVALLGLSLGACVCARIYDNEIRAMVFWAPVTNSAEKPEDYYGPDKVKELAETGVINRLREGTLRQKIVIDKKLFEEWKAINQEELLSGIDIPVLIVHGDNDQRVPLSDSRQALKYLPSGSRLEVVEGADHIFNEQIDVFIELTDAWFKEKLDKGPTS
ncbi:alpha/beta hydrolase [Candidatus Microgenomates bacterium]|nr:alpha/beta hydrolase [Candidatus Microgenomates bacterium]